jgi:hypothetical protein
MKTVTETSNEQRMEINLQETPRRKSRELYSRFLLRRANVDDTDAEIFLTTGQPGLEGLSPLEAIYTGNYEAAIAAVEAFTEDLIPEDL